MATISIKYIGDLRCKSIHLKSGNMLLTDAPTDNNGKGVAFSPTDTLATALGTCMLTIMGIKAREMKIDIDGSEIEITKIMASNPRRVQEVILRMTVHYAHITDNDKKSLEYSAINCPVAKSLHSDLLQSVIFVYKQKTPTE